MYLNLDIRAIVGVGYVMPSAHRQSLRFSRFARVAGPVQDLYRVLKPPQTGRTWIFRHVLRHNRLVGSRWQPPGVDPRLQSEVVQVQGVVMWYRYVIAHSIEAESLAHEAGREDCTHRSAIISDHGIGVPIAGQ